MTAVRVPDPAPVRGPGRGRRTRGPVFWLGTLLLAAGLGVLAYVGWQMFGTNVVSRHRAEQIETQTRTDWARGYAGPAQAILHVPRFGAKYSVPIIRGFDEKTLAKGIARYPRSADAGQIGNYVLAGHRITHGEPFSKFPSLRPGDKVVVETRTATYTYRLRGSGTSTIVDFTAAWPLFAVPRPGAGTERPTHAEITLLTCSELFHTDKRSVVIGDLVRTTPPSRPAA